MLGELWPMAGHWGLKVLADWRLTATAKAERQRDRQGLPAETPDLETAIREAVAWLCRAQDSSLSADGGVAHNYSLIHGWSTSYPETTGYIVPTLLAAADRGGELAEEIRQRARRMLDWLVKVQLPCGAFQAGLIDTTPVVPVTFNTGQVLLGLAAGVRVFGDEFRPALSRAADWLVKTQDADGCWRQYPTPFAVPGEKTYETHVAWGLLEAARLGESRWADAALANVQWALRKQAANGWFDLCCLSDRTRPLTHTLGYALRGIIEAYRFTNDPELLRRPAYGRRFAEGPAVRRVPARPPVRRLERGRVLGVFDRERANRSRLAATPPGHGRSALPRRRPRRQSLRPADAPD